MLATTDPRPVKFTIGEDDRPFDGFATGETWNGFDIIEVDGAVRDELIAYVVEAAGEEYAEDLRELTADERGRFDLTGYVTTIVARCD